MEVQEATEVLEEMEDLEEVQLSEELVVQVEVVEQRALYIQEVWLEIIMDLLRIIHIHLGMFLE
jgi:hypothetical protein